MEINEDTLKAISKLKDTLSLTEEEIIKRDKKLTFFLQQQHAKNELISLLNEKIKHLEKELDLMGTKISEERPKLREILEQKEKQIISLSERLKKKDSEQQMVLENIRAGEPKNELLTKFNSEIEKLKKEKEMFQKRIFEDENAISKLIQELKQKEDIIEKIVRKNELLLRAMKEKTKEKWEEKINSLFEQINEKNRTINLIITEAKKAESEIAKKELIIETVKKEESEKNRLLAKLAHDLEKHQEINKKMFDDVVQLKSLVKLKEKENTELNSRIFLIEKDNDLLKNKLLSLSGEENSLKKEIDMIDETYSMEKKSLSEETIRLNNELKDERQKYEHRIKKLLKDNMEKEIENKAIIDELRDALEKQNYLVATKENREKEIVDEINSKFAEIFALREQITNIPKNIPKENQFLEKDEFKIQELDNIKALIKVSLQHEKNIDRIKNSLKASGYDSKLIEEATKEFMVTK
jgi:hypothetical protein